MKNKKGVTFIGLIVAFVVAALGVVLLVPDIGGWLPNYRLRSATRDIVSAMRSAQKKSVTSPLRYRVNLNSTDVGVNTYTLEYHSGGNWHREGGLRRLPAGIVISNNTLPNQRAEFYTNSTSSAGTITLTNTIRGRSRVIALTPDTGRVNVN